MDISPNPKWENVTWGLHGFRLSHISGSELSQLRDAVPAPQDLVMPTRHPHPPDLGTKSLMGGAFKMGRKKLDLLEITPKRGLASKYERHTNTGLKIQVPSIFLTS